MLAVWLLDAPTLFDEVEVVVSVGLVLAVPVTVGELDRDEVVVPVTEAVDVELDVIVALAELLDVAVRVSEGDRVKLAVGDAVPLDVTVELPVDVSLLDGVRVPELLAVLLGVVDAVLPALLLPEGDRDSDAVIDDVTVGLAVNEDDVVGSAVKLPVAEFVRLPVIDPVDDSEAVELMEPLAVRVPVELAVELELLVSDPVPLLVLLPLWLAVRVMLPEAVTLRVAVLVGELLPVTLTVADDELVREPVGEYEAVLVRVGEGR